ncbi:hypothetical protein MAR_029539 [Mya arenaria]|uniref:Uncharacterized protein n=1 Tax=Mya arenaria TaxID=6604 RepID=A0ABY7DHQ9_MYAAR|nr:hypothetical protein MAR_029539 [Mya arenaria]
MSPASMQLPTMNNWDMGPQHSPYNNMNTSSGPPYSSGNFTGGQSGGPGTPGSYPQNVPSPQNGSFNMLPMSPMNNTMANLTMNSGGDMMNKGMNPSSQVKVNTHSHHPPTPHSSVTQTKS